MALRFKALGFPLLNLLNWLGFALFFESSTTGVGLADSEASTVSSR